MTSKSTPVRILLADDDQSVRSAVRRILEAQRDFQVIAEAETGRQVLDISTALQPDVVILDINMPELDGLETARELQKDVPKTRIVFLSMYADRRFVQRAANLGVSGYVLKDRALSQLAEATRIVIQGGHYVSPEVRAGSTEIEQDAP